MCEFLLLVCRFNFSHQNNIWRAYSRSSRSWSLFFESLSSTFNIHAIRFQLRLSHRVFTQVSCPSDLQPMKLPEAKEAYNLFEWSIASKNILTLSFDLVNLKVWMRNDSFELFFRALNKTILLVIQFYWPNFSWDIFLECSKAFAPHVCSINIVRSSILHMAWPLNIDGFHEIKSIRWRRLNKHDKRRHSRFNIENEKIILLDVSLRWRVWKMNSRCAINFKKSLFFLLTRRQHCVVLN